MIRRHLPGSAAALTIDHARLAMARQHGFETFARSVASTRDGDEEPFLRSVRAIRADDGRTLVALLDRYPGLVAARGTNGNDLAGLATPMGRLAIVRLLLDRGADSTIQDRVHHGTPLSWAQHFASHEVAAILHERAR